MKKLLLTLLCIGSALAAYADSYTIQFQTATSDASNFNAAKAYEKGSEYISTQTATNAYAPCIKGLKLSSSSKNGQFVITLTESGKVAATSIVVNAAKWKSSENATININNSSKAVSLSDDLQDYTFNLDGSTIEKITIDATKRCYVSSITVNYDSGQVDPDKQPVELSFGENADVTLSADEISSFVAPTLTTNPSNLAVSYESNNTAVAAVDAEGNVTLTGKVGETTIKASFDGDDTYAAGYASYVIKVIPTYETLAALIQHKTEEEVAAIGNFAVLYQSGDYLLITDGTSNALIYKAGNTYEIGTAISKIEGKVTIYQDLFEMTNVTVTEGGEGASIAPYELASLSDVTYENKPFDFITVKGASISGVSKNNATLSLGDETISLYNRFSVEGFENAENITLTGFITINNTKTQIWPISIEAEPVDPDKQPAELSFGEKTDFEVILGYNDDEFVAPALINPNDLTVTYESSDEEVALVDEKDGTVLLMGTPGEATIYATFVGDEKYAEATVSYTITVKEMETCATPTFSATEIYAGESITITCATEKATIIYGDNLEEGVSPVTITFSEVGNYIIEAYATKDGYNDSEVVKATITVTEKPATISETIVISNFPNVTNSYTADTYTSTVTNVTYSAKVAKKDENIQCNGTLGNGIAVTENPNGYTIKSISVEVDGSTLSKRTIKFFGQNEVYTSISATGNEIGSINTTSDDYTATFETTTNDLVAFAMSVSGGAAYITSITIEWVIPAPAAPEVTIGGLSVDDLDAEIDLDGGSITVTLTAEEGHHIYHKHEATVAAADYYFDVVEEGEHAGFNKVESNEATITVDKNGTLTFYAHNPQTNLKSEPVSLNFVNDITTSISEIEAAGKVEYFDMQGRRVAAPANGLFIRREGNAATKVRL